MKNKCKTCKWFEPFGAMERRDNGGYITFDPKDPEFQRGECRIGPPGFGDLWPIIWEDQYCGRHILYGNSETFQPISVEWYCVKCKKSTIRKLPNIAPIKCYSCIE